MMGTCRLHAETDMGTGKTVTKAAAAADKQEFVEGKGKTTVKYFIAIALIIALAACIAFLFVKTGN